MECVLLELFVYIVQRLLYIYVNDSKFDQNRTMLDGAHTAHNVCAHRFGFSRAQNMTAADKLQFGLNILAFCIRLQDIYMKS